MVTSISMGGTGVYLNDTGALVDYRYLSKDQQYQAWRGVWNNANRPQWTVDVERGAISFLEAQAELWVLPAPLPVPSPTPTVQPAPAPQPEQDSSGGSSLKRWLTRLRPLVVRFMGILSTFGRMGL